MGIPHLAGSKEAQGHYLSLVSSVEEGIETLMILGTYDTTIQRR
jgi:hypothetical protein